MSPTCVLLASCCVLMVGMSTGLPSQHSEDAIVPEAEFMATDAATQSWGTYPGFKASSALPVNFYTGFNAEFQTPYNIGYDAQAVHGVEHSSGWLISVGHSWEKPTGSADNGPRSAFVVAGSGDTGEMQWYYNSDIPLVDEGVVAVMQIEGSDDVLAAGFRKDVGGKYQRWLIRLRPPTAKPTKEEGEELQSFVPKATLVWEKAFGPTTKEKPSTHSTFESISTDGKGGVLLGGVSNNVEGQEFKYKSAGNVPAGDAFAWRISKEDLDSIKDPKQPVTVPGGQLENDAITWQYITSQWTSIKAIRVDTNGNAIAALHREQNNQMHAGLVSLAVSDGSVLWGPKFYPEQTEATDIAVAPDGSGFVITGHGSTATSGPARYLGRLTRVTAAGEYLWTQTITYEPTHTDVIYNECWGVQADPPVWADSGPKGWILSCGTGVENTAICNDPLIGLKKADCLAGLPKQWGGRARKPSTWANMVPAFQDSVTKGQPATLLWQSVTSFDTSSTGSSAAEFISHCKTGGYYVTTDEVFGVGILRLGGLGSPPAEDGSTSAPPPPLCEDMPDAAQQLESGSGGAYTSCTQAQEAGLCGHETHGAAVKALCPKTCGACL